MADRIPVSVIVLTKNEEKDIEGCLDALRRFDDVVVVDSLSTDRTRELALAHGARVVDFEWNGQYPKKKQWALEHAELRHDWVLYVDADETATPGLVDEIAAATAGAQHAGWFVRLEYVFLGRTLHHGQQVHKLVLFRRDRGRFVDHDDLDAENMWEVEGHYQPTIEGTTGTLRHPLVHHDHDSLFDYFSRHNRYSDWEAVLQEKTRGVTAESARGPMKRAFAAMPARPLAWFVYSYLLRGGFLDGRAGFHYAVAKAFYYWQIGVKRRELAGRR